MTWLFVATRAVHFAGCLLILCVPLFDRFAVGSLAQNESIGRHWRKTARWFLWLAFPLAILSGVAWLGFNAINMSGLPVDEALKPPILKLVLTDTHFGKLWEFRAGLMLLAIAFSLLLPIIRWTSVRRVMIWLLAIASALLSGSLAWAGHGITGGPQPLHLWADAFHILICAFWPIGLLPFALLLSKLAREASLAQWQAIATLTRRFSTTSLASVAILVLSGLVNSWGLIGSPSLLLTTLYGRVLVAKVAAFFLMIALGAMNMLHLKPKLSLDLTEGTATQGESARRRLQANVTIELALGTLVIILVGLLGLLPPAAEALMHEHHH